eukprot:TRINITY_DN5693_c0_g1_i1.p1 TRINITY_DN5693_c0_g1~~TRINITY_DN5693_c0_g1_i1.p1  ORF type:complete len:286 (-),score=28.86 TRINITY_DN5693_c0_g1_i1:3-800(-)
MSTATPDLNEEAKRRRERILARGQNRIKAILNTQSSSSSLTPNDEDLPATHLLHEPTHSLPEPSSSFPPPSTSESQSTLEPSSSTDTPIISTSTTEIKPNIIDASVINLQSPHPLRPNLSGTNTQSKSTGSLYGLSDVQLSFSRPEKIFVCLLTIAISCLLSFHNYLSVSLLQELYFDSSFARSLTYYGTLELAFHIFRLVRFYNNQKRKSKEELIFALKKNVSDVIAFFFDAVQLFCLFIFCFVVVHNLLTLSRGWELPEKLAE